MTLALPLWVNCRQGGWRGDWRRYYSSKNLLVNSIRTNTLSLIYKQPRFWATSLKLQWLLILVALIQKI